MSEQNLGKQEIYMILLKQHSATFTCMNGAKYNFLDHINNVIRYGTLATNNCILFFFLNSAQGVSTSSGR